MLKKVLLGLALVASFSAVSAQELQSKHIARLNKKSSELKLKTRDVNPQVLTLGSTAGTAFFAAPQSSASSMLKAPAATIWFRNSFTESDGKCYIVGWSDFKYYSSENTTDYNYAVIIPSRFAAAVIDSVVNVFNDVDKISDCTLWISNVKVDEEGYISIPSEAKNAEYYQAVSSSEIKGKTGSLANSKIALKSKFTVGSEGCIIGFEFKATEGARPIVCGGTGVDGGWIMKLTYQGQTGWGNFNVNGNLPIGAHMDVSACASNDMTVNGVIESTFKPGECEIPVSVTNNAYKAVESVSYILAIDGTKQAETAMTLDENYQIEGGSNDALYIPATITEGEHFVSVEVTKVNGETNAATTTSGTGYVLGVENPADRVSVVEEGTSTACGYCPRGTVGLRKVKEALGDKVIPLSIHADYTTKANDPMVCDDYASFFDFFSMTSFPNAIVDRVAGVDPYVGLGIGTDYYEEDANGNLTKYKFALDKSVTMIANAYPSEGSVALSASLNDKTITANTTTTFNVNRESAPYSLVFVLTENCMTGKDSGKTQWTQSNYYAQEYIDYYAKYGYDYSTYFIDSDMDEYKNGAYDFTETYNNVVVAAWGGTYNGMDACPIYGISAFGDDIEKGEPMTYNTTFDISKNTLIQGYDHLYLAVLLINNNNSQIVNAAQVKLVDPTSINSAVKDNSKTAEVVRYSVDGRKLDAPVKGLNIVKMADGSSKKVLVK